MGTASTRGESGIPFYLNFAIYQYASSGCTPLQNARVDVWHADASGVYSQEASQAETTESTATDNFLRGYQLTDSSGQVSYTSIFPGWYTGRTTHVHLRIRTYDSSGNVSTNVTTQVFVDDAISSLVYSNSSYYTRSKTRDTYNTNDSIYKASLLLSLTGSVNAGYTSSVYGIGLPFSS